ncbi:MAG: hypothetical protein ACK4Z5_08475 [Brevundimonas sp.]
MSEPSPFLFLTRQDGYRLSVRPETIVAFMPASDAGTLIWFAGAATTDFQHVKEAPNDVGLALGATPSTTLAKPKAPRAKTA